MNVNKNSQMKIELKRDDRQTSKNMATREDIEMREDTKMEKLKKLINKNNAWVLNSKLLSISKT